VPTRWPALPERITEYLQETPVVALHGARMPPRTRKQRADRTAIYEWDGQLRRRCYFWGTTVFRSRGRKPAGSSKSVAAEGERRILRTGRLVQVNRKTPVNGKGTKHRLYAVWGHLTERVGLLHLSPTRTTDGVVLC